MFKKENSMSVKRRKGNRRGFAGDDVTDNQDYIEEVVPEEDDSYVVEGTDSPEGIKKESTIITDDHDVVSEEDYGTEEEFLAESEDGEAEVIKEDGGESREGRRRGRKVNRLGSRLGESDEDEIEEDLEELEEDIEDRKGNKSVRRGSRRGDTVDVVTDEEGNTEEVELPEPDEREGRRKGIRRGSRRGESDPFEESFSVRERENVTEDIKSAFREEGLPGIVRDLSATSQAGTNICKRLSNKWNCSQDAAEIIFDTVVSGGMLGSARQGSRRGSVYGGRSPEHQESIRSAVSVAMKDRRL